MFAPLLFGLAVITVLLWALGGVGALRGTMSIRPLAAVPPLFGAGAPPVSVIIAARNEERNVEAALRSVLGQDYHALEVIVVDDRSTDSTGEILDRLQTEHDRLRVVHLSELPVGWLGKNHALQHGADRATGDLLLFADADVVMAPSAVSRAVGYLSRHSLDHVAVAPELVMPGPLLDLFGGTFSLLFGQYARPWKARDPRSTHHVGIGAFNLVRAEAYRAAGRHRAIRMRPDDDMKLGKLLKRTGHRQDVLFGRDMVSVEWYSSVAEAVRGFEKNAFAGFDYSLAAVAAGTAALLLFDVWPFAAAFLTHGATRMLNIAAVLIILAFYARNARAAGVNPLYGIGFPAATLFFLYIVWRSTLLTLMRRGIDWRGTRYPLDELRANRV